MSVQVTVKYYVKTQGGRTESNWTGRADGPTESAVMAALKRERSFLRDKEVVITDIKER